MKDIASIGIMSQYIECLVERYERGEELESIYDTLYYKELVEIRNRLSLIQGDIL